MPVLPVSIDPRAAITGGRKLRREIAKIRRETRETANAQKLLQAQLAKTGKTARATGMGMGRMFTGLAALAAVTKMVKVWGNLEDAMARVKGVVRGTDEQMRLLEHTARRLGAATSFTATESAQGMLMLSRAGMSTGEVVAATGAVLDLAKVAAIGLQESATLTADSLKQFSMSAQQAREAADTLAFAANKSNTDITQLGEGLKLAGPIASAAGMSLKDTAVVLGILADSGLKATLGGTGVRAMLASLSDPSDSAAAALKEMNINTDELGKELIGKNGLLNILKRLGPETMGVTKAIQVFSRRGAAAALILARSTERWEEFNKEMEKSGGTVRDSAALIEDTLGDAFKQMGSALEEATHKVGDKGLAGGLKSLVVWLTDGIRALTNFGAACTQSAFAAAALLTTLIGGGLIGQIIKVGVAAKATGGIIARVFRFIGKHPVLLAVSALSLLVQVFIRLKPAADFATEEFVKFNETVQDLAFSTDALVASWASAMDLMDMTKQEKAVRSHVAQMEKLHEAVSAMVLGEQRKLLPPGYLDDLERAAKLFAGVEGAPAFVRPTITTPEHAEGAKAVLALRAAQGKFLPSGRGGQIATPSAALGGVTGEEMRKAKADPMGLTPGIKPEDAQAALREGILLYGQLADVMQERNRAARKENESIIDGVNSGVAALDRETAAMEIITKSKRKLLDQISQEKTALTDGEAARDREIAQTKLVDQLVKKENQGREKGLLTREMVMATRKEEIAGYMALHDNLVKAKKATEDKLKLDDEIAERAEATAAREKMLADTRTTLLHSIQAETVQLTRGVAAREVYQKKREVIDELAAQENITREQATAIYREELAVINKMLEAETRLKDSNQSKLAAAAKKIADEKDDAAKEAAAQQKEVDERRQHAANLANAMVQPLVQALQSGDWSNVGATILAQIQAAMISEVITKPLITGLTNIMATGAWAGAGKAKGAAYIGGVERFARGGVVGEATAFGMAGGRMGIMGEAGPEAIMPLRRGPGGRLGVEAQGGGQVVNDNRTINIQVRDDASFRRTMRQLDRDTVSRLKRGMSTT